jgi:hypothetical protein
VNQAVFDELPNNSGHLVAVEFDNDSLYCDFLHLTHPSIAVPTLVRESSLPGKTDLSLREDTLPQPVSKAYP